MGIAVGVSPECMLKTIPLTLALLLWQSVPAQLPQESAAHLSYFRYRRSLVVPAAEGEACAVLDAPIFPHAAPYLKDVRLYRNEGISLAPQTPSGIIRFRTSLRSANRRSWRVKTRRY